MLDRFFAVNPWLSYVLSIVVVLVAAEIGNIAGNRIRRRNPDAMSTEITTFQSAALGLLALIIGFTFAMTLSLYDARKKAVLDEANAIRTTALRAEVLPAPNGEQIHKLLRDYIQLRIAMIQARKSPALFEQTIRRSQELQGQLWRYATAVGAADPRSNPAALFAQALNQMIDLQELRTRLFASPTHVPNIVYVRCSM